MRTSVRRGTVAFICALLLAPGSSPASGADPSERYTAIRDSFLALRQDTERQRFRHNYLRIIGDFEAFVSDHPAHPRAPAALFNAGQLAWDLYKVSRVAGDLRQARRLFMRLVEEYPRDSLADDGLFLVGRILLEHGGDPGEAYLTFLAVTERFPHGDMVPRAREMLGRLSDHAPAPQAGQVEEAKPASRVLARSGAWQGQAGATPAVVGTPSVEVSESMVRIVLPLAGQASHRQGEVPADFARGLPRRAYLDLKPARLDATALDVTVEHGGVRRARVGQFSPDTVRVVLDLSEERSFNLFPLLAEGSLVLDIARGQPLASIAMGSGGDGAPDGVRPHSGNGVENETGDVAPSVDAARVRERLSIPQEVPLSVQAGLKVRRVVIDPGHGGHDVGAVGPTGLNEKDVTLSIAKKLGDRLGEHGLEVIYTRTEDVFVPLETRTAVANDQRADLFISIHANAANRRDRHGVTTYYLDVTSDRYAMRLAARENATAQRSVGELQLILADLTTRHNTDESARLASRIQGSLVRRLSRQHSDVRCLGVQYALFYVLLGARMPSVLVETSFISNPAEERRLADDAYQDQVAQGIFEGILAFMSDRDRLAMGY